LTDFLESFLAIPCPQCGIENEATVGEIVRESTIMCRGCLSTIQLLDHNGELHRTLDLLQRTL